MSKILTPKIKNKRARIIFNPTSGKESLKPKLLKILSIFEKAGYETSVFTTTPKPHSARNEAKKVALEGYDLVVAAGGDGTINEVVNGIAPLSKPYRPALAIIPSGTTNDFARALHIPRTNPVRAAQLILKHQSFDMDVGKANNNYFINIAGGGLLTELTYDVPSDLKTIFGYLAYLVKGAELLPKIRPINMDLKYDDGHFRGKASLFLLCMTNSVGGLEHIVPHAALDNGKFTLIIVKTSNVVQILQLLAKIIKGKGLNDPRIFYTKTNHLIAKPVDKPMEINLDGEYGGNAPMKFIDLKRHIKVFANLDAMPQYALTSKVTHRSYPWQEQSMENTFLNKVNRLFKL